MAERVGFEPTVPAKVQQFSRLPDSTTLAPLRPCKNIPESRRLEKQRSRKGDNKIRRSASRAKKILHQGAALVAQNAGGYLDLMVQFWAITDPEDAFNGSKAFVM